ncbi:YfhO family protein [Enterococcus sp. 2201sp1_2201st1_C11_2201SCRN_220225]|uniref:YfhO family protein n=3 Tax=unclassified Enterococcus TaxID=2608891 RepID=UPI0034A3F3A4
MKNKPANMIKFFKLKKNYIYVFIGLVFLLMMLYSAVFFGDWKLSFTNVTYNFAPFDSLGVKIKGPWLSDPADNVYPIAYQSIHNLSFSSWITTLGIGAPQSMMLYMFFMNYLFLLPFDIAPLIISIVKILIAFGSMYAFIRRIYPSRLGAFISGVSYALCSTMIVWHGWPHSEVTMFAPLLFLIMDLLTEKFKVSYLIIGSLVVFNMLVAGMPTYVAYFMYLLGCYVLFYGIKKFWRDKKKLALYFFIFFLCVLFGTLLSLPYTAELLQTVGGNGYNESRKGLATAKLDWDYLRSLFFPYVRNGLDIHVNEATLYTGLLAIASLPLTLLNVKSKPKSIFFFTSLILLVIIVFTNVLSPAYQLLPLVNTSIRYRLIVLINFCLCVLIGLNVGDFFLKIDSYRNKKIRTSALLLSGGLLYYIAFTTISSYKLSAALTEQVENSKIIVLAFVSICFIVLFIRSKHLTSLGSLLVVILVVFDMTSFGSYYLPLIEEEASVVPPMTDSISYIQENTKEQEKIVGVGQWTFFASNNMYYDIRDIRGHNFVYTNADMQKYYKAIDEDAYSTPTRIGFQKIGNENLLKYMGVKYIVKESEGSSDREPFISGVVPVGLMHNGIRLTQSFKATKDNLSTLKLMVGTYKGEFTKEQGITVQVVDSDSGKTIRETTTSLLRQKDNDYITFSFDPISLSHDKEYDLIVSTNVPASNPITLYVSNEKTYEGDFSEDGFTGNLVLQPYYNGDGQRVGNDGLTVEELPAYSDQIQLTDKVIIEDSSKAVLNSMEKSFNPDTAYFDGSTEHPEIKNINTLSSEEKVTNISNRENGTITFDASVSEERVILINEYNDGNWHAYIDGEEVPLYKGNYLFRAIVVPKGTHNVELKYENAKLNIFWIISIVTGVGLLLIILFRKRVNHFLQKVGKSSNSMNFHEEA